MNGNPTAKITPLQDLSGKKGACAQVFKTPGNVLLPLKATEDNLRINETNKTVSRSSAEFAERKKVHVA